MTHDQNQEKLKTEKYYNFFGLFKKDWHHRLVYGWKNLFHAFELNDDTACCYTTNDLFSGFESIQFGKPSTMMKFTLALGSGIF